MAQSLPSCLQRLALGLGFSRSHPPSAHTPPSQCSLLTARTPQGFLLHSPAMRTLSGLTLRFQVTAGVLSYLLMPSQCLGVELNAPGHFISLHGEHLSLGELAVAPLAMFWTRHFKESIKFIHECRLRGEGCLVHCLAGVSRSVTLVIAYIMTVTDFGWEDALHTVRAGRSCANPNLGFQRQLQDFEKHEVHQYRQWLKEEYGESPLRDAEEARNILGLVLPPFPLCKTPRGRHLKLTSKKLLSQKQPVRVSRQRGELKGRPSSCKRRPSQNPGWSQQGQQEARLPPEGGSRGRGRMGALTSPQC
uniref:Dual specificity phosphatase 22 n=1 Tax=Equus asinus TaxID=9793 RepID=A0A9L0K9I1_EQUAS